MRLKVFPPTELALTSDNRVYHLGLSADQIAETILLVGDQDRVSLISKQFDTIEHQSQHREFVCHTGTYRGKRVTALSTGIGTDNIDITVNELDALVNIDLETRTEREIKKITPINTHWYLWNFTTTNSNSQLYCNYACFRIG